MDFVSTLSFPNPVLLSASLKSHTFFNSLVLVVSTLTTIMYFVHQYPQYRETKNLDYKGLIEVFLSSSAIVVGLQMCIFAFEIDSLPPEMLSKRVKNTDSFSVFLLLSGLLTVFFLLNSIFRVFQSVQINEDKKKEEKRNEGETKQLGESRSDDSVQLPHDLPQN